MWKITGFFTDEAPHLGSAARMVSLQLQAPAAGHGPPTTVHVVLPIVDATSLTSDQLRAKAIVEMRRALRTISEAPLA